LFWKSFLAKYIIEHGKARKWQTVKKNVEMEDLVPQIQPGTDSGN
jgi:hypothetical protein